MVVANRLVVVGTPASREERCGIAHITGIKVLAPATVRDARTMLPAARREPDPLR